MRLTPFRRGAGAFLSAWRKQSIFTAKNKGKCLLSLPEMVSGTYFITSEKGLFRADISGLHLILPTPLYGCTIVGDKVVMGLYLDTDSILVEGNSSALFKKGESFQFREIMRVKTNDTKERIHQVTSFGNHIWSACTSMGALVHYEIGDSSIEFIYPLRDFFSAPVQKNINHINSVIQYGETVLFTAYRAGKGSLIGAINGPYVRAYEYENVGVHDIYLTQSGFLFFDTFGCGRDDRGGVPVTESGCWKPEFFDAAPGYILRGAAEGNNEILIGSSHKGKRALRFAGNGKLLRIVGGEIVSIQELPFAQVYQIITEHGEHLLPPEILPSFEEVCTSLNRRLGGPVYEGIVHSEIRSLASD